MKGLKKLISLTAALSMGIMLFAGCSKGTAEPAQADSGGQSATTDVSTNAVAPSEKVTIKHWVWLDNPEDTTLQEMVNDFNAQSETTNVELVVVPWGEYYNQLLTATIVGGAPDTAAFKLTWVPEFAANNSLVALDSYIDKWDKKDDIIDNLWDVMKVAEDGNTYVLPWITQILYMYYRPSMFAEAGVEIPTTFDAFLQAAQKLTKDTDGDGRVDQYGFGMRGARYGHEPWGSFIWAFGGKFVDESGNVILNSPETVEGTQAFIDLFQNGYTPPTAVSDGFAEIIGNFEAGRTAMTVHHIRSSKQMEDKFGDDVSAFPIPAGPKGRWTSMGDTENVVLSASKHPENAFEFISWLAEADQVDKWCRADGNVPICKSVEALDYYQQNRFMKASLESASYAGVYPVRESMGEWIESIWPTTMQRALEGEITAEKAVEILAEAMAGK